MDWQTVALPERLTQAEGLSPLADPPQTEGVISLATGYPHPSLMATSQLSTAMARAVRRPLSWDRPPTKGIESLRTWFARTLGPETDPEDVQITPGGQGALSSAIRSLTRPGDPLLVESPTYPGVLAIARAAGVRPVPVPIDEQGVIPELLAEAFSRTRVQVFYCQPLFQNPTGAVLSRARRRTVLDVAKEANAFVIEDDFARLLSHRRKPPKPLYDQDREGRVVYVTSLTKAASINLRVGALVARGPVGERIRVMRAIDDILVPRPLQETAVELVSAPQWNQHLLVLTRLLGRRLEVMARGLRRLAPAASFDLPTGGMNLWVRLPRHLDDVEAAGRARQAGVVVMPGRYFFPSEPAGPHLRFTFSAASEGDLQQGVERLAVALPELAQGAPASG